MPGSYGMYSTQQLPSLLSVQDILASEGPSIASPSPPVPAPLHKNNKRENDTEVRELCNHNCDLTLSHRVSTVNLLCLLVMPD